MPNTITKLPDGNIEVKYDTGEVFTGDPMQVTQKLADAREERARSLRETRQEFDQYRTQHPETIATPSAPEPTAEQKQLRQYLTTEVAADLGLKPEELRALPSLLARQQQAISEWQRSQAVLNFQNKHPEFPNTDEANDAVIERAQKDFQVDIDALSIANPEQAAAVLGAAHLACVNEGVYKPLSSEQINATWANNMQAASRGTPPPMIRGGSPDANQQGFNPWDTKNVKLDDLRAAAIRQELEGRQR